MKIIIPEKPYKIVYGSSVGRVRFLSNEDIKNKNILDIGCGFGWFEYYSIKKSAKTVTGCDISEDVLEIARKNVADKRVRFKKGNALSLPFKDESFDTVVAWEVIEHLPKNSEDKFIGEVYRVLRKKGSFYLSTPNDHIIAKIVDPAWWLIGHRHYSISKLRELGNKVKFDLEKYKIRGKYFSIIYIFNMYIAKWLFARKPFYEKILKEKFTNEFKGTDGFTNIFVKYKK